MSLGKHINKNVDLRKTYKNYQLGRYFPRIHQNKVALMMIPWTPDKMKTRQWENWVSWVMILIPQIWQVSHREKCPRHKWVLHWRKWVQGRHALPCLLGLFHGFQTYYWPQKQSMGLHCSRQIKFGYDSESNKTWSWQDQTLSNFNFLHSKQPTEAEKTLENGVKSRICKELKKIPKQRKNSSNHRK